MRVSKVANSPPVRSPRDAGSPTAARSVAARTKLLLEGPICLLAGIVGLGGGVGAAGQQACRPVLAFKEVHFSEMQPITLQRKWTATVSVDASRCVANSQGHFGIVFRRLKEVGPEIDFREQFVWRPPSVTVEVDFSADEAVQTYWVDHVEACTCSR